MLPPLPILDDCLFIDNSGWMESLSLCKRLVEYKVLHNRISSMEKPSLNFGSAIHIALEHRHRYFRSGPVTDEYYNDVSKLLAEFFEQHPPPVDDWRELNWAMTLLRKYLAKYPTEEFAVLVDSQDVPLVELPFVIELFRYSFPESFANRYKNIPKVLRVIYQGKIDLPLSLDGGIWVMDHKTTSMLGASFFDRMRMSAQQKGYCWAFEQLTKQKVSGYIVNAIRTKQPPLYVLAGKEYSGRGKTQTPDQWWNESFQRERYILKPGDLDEWKENAIVMLEEFFWNYMRGVMPMETANSCTAWGRCQYFDVCTMAREDRMLMLNSGQFTNNTWSPLKQPTQSKQ